MTAESVRDIYNEKARGWRAKYNAGGPLAHRIDAFGQKLAEVRPAPARVLDFGCGTGNLAAHLAGRGYEVTACDIAEQMIAEAKAAFPEAKVDWNVLSPNWRELPFEINSFDVITASSVFEYVLDLDRVLHECARVLTPGGLLIISVPNPAHAVRRVEGALQVATAPIPNATRERLPGRVRSYLRYLTVSRNRLSAGGWGAKARIAGLDLIQTQAMGAPIVPVVLTEAPLLLLTFRR